MILSGIRGSLMMCLFMAGCVVVSAVEEPDRRAEYNRYRETYNKELQKIGEDQISSLSTLQDGYIQTLKSLESKMQAQGNLDLLLEVQKERTRFEKQRAVSEADLNEKIPALLAAQNQYRESIKGPSVSSARRTMALVSMYDANLSKLQAQLTKEGELDVAIEIKKEREGMGERAEVIEARKIMEAADAALKAQQAQDKAKADSAAAATAEKAAASSKPVKKYTGKPEVQVRKRAKEMLKLAELQEWEKARSYVDPGFVKQNGERLVDVALRMKFGMARMADERANVELQIDSITMAETSETAVVIPEVRINNQSHKLERMNWAEVDGEWYLALDVNEIQNPPGGGGRGPENQKQQKEQRKMRNMMEKNR